jgi:excisionase family DNA binding protein
MTTRDVAVWLHVSEETVRRLVRAGEIRAAHVGGVLRFLPEDVDEYVARSLGARREG